MKLSKYWTSIAALTFAMTLGILVSCSRQLASVPTIPATPTNSPTITNTFTPIITNTPCGYPGNTCTFTNTPTVTNTPAGPTPTPFNYEDFDQALGPSGNCWVASPAAAYMTNNYGVSGGSFVANYDTTTFNTSTASEQFAVTFTAASKMIPFGICSAENNSACGAAYTVPGTVTATTSTLSFWIHPVTQDAAPLNYQVGLYVGATYWYDGANAQGTPDTTFTAPSGSWTQVSIPLDTAHWDSGLAANGTSWSVFYVFIGVLGPASASAGSPYGLLVNVDDIYFNH